MSLLGEGVDSNVGRVAGFVSNTQTINLRLTKDELKDFSLIHAEIARIALKEENKKGFLLHHNRFVDGKQWKIEEQVKFGGKIVYDDIYSLTEVMRYIDERVKKLMPRGKTGHLRLSHGWYLNGSPIQQGVEVNYQPKDRLVCMAFIRYAKYQEVGTIRNKAAWMYKKVRRHAARRFGRGFIFEHRMFQAGEIKSGQMTKKLYKRSGAFSDEYYKERWENVYPGIKVTLRRNVKYK